MTKKELRKARGFVAHILRRAKHRLYYKTGLYDDYRGCCGALQGVIYADRFNKMSCFDLDIEEYVSDVFKTIFNKRGSWYWWGDPHEGNIQDYDARFIALELAALAVLSGDFDQELVRYASCRYWNLDFS